MKHGDRSSPLRRPRPSSPPATTPASSSPMAASRSIPSASAGKPPRPIDRGSIDGRHRGGGDLHDSLSGLMASDSEGLLTDVDEDAQAPFAAIAVKGPGPRHCGPRAGDLPEEPAAITRQHGSPFSSFSPTCRSCRSAIEAWSGELERPAAPAVGHRGRLAAGAGRAAVGPTSGSTRPRAAIRSGRPTSPCRAATTTAVSRASLMSAMPPDSGRKASIIRLSASGQ